MKKRKILFLPHGNLQYSQLDPEKRGWVAQQSYEPLFDLVASDDRYRIGFEASGKTLEIMAEQYPKSLDKLKALVKEGRIEGVASPHTHIMLSNIDPEIGFHSLLDGLDSWERYVGVRPETGWNPECSWAEYLPSIYREAGFKNLIGDADSLFLSFDEIREATGLSYDVRSHSNKNKLFRIEDYIKDKPDFLRLLTNPTELSNGLRLIFRSDMMANPMLWYLMGATEGNRETPVQLDEIRESLERWSQRVEETGSFIMPYAEDAEYIGTSAYFYVKQFNEARFFEPMPESVDRFKELLDVSLDLGYELGTPAEVIESSQEIIKSDQVYKVDNGIAWHGGTAKAWANTVYSRIMDPVCRDIHDGLRRVSQRLGTDFGTMRDDLQEARRLLTNAWVSDSRWPPLPTTPGRFNVKESIADLKEANTVLENVIVTVGLVELKSLYSPELIRTQIASIEEELMAMEYFEESVVSVKA
ncbi:hypothetical protein QEH56_02855 [Pelagicoccus enzymogenes]|uniref:hypothetical protein n=1 Tax=Pelagicoccus enzymogenes TaxID=2773457 RepID=UPI00280F60FE|nr:hypothetical protein [Pelagicoccus enzymogenes]MDQ8197068.1 hypothetical protein [Pelagicoccus enzymogenes]